MEVGLAALTISTLLVHIIGVLVWCGRWLSKLHSL